ncbi:hypothetical protein HRG_006819 [Hirsutella rhossiliensis]|uniref:Uncharacterized protein n=1 Tax=Hirsutella rhossiliensis TaxID=111463 RepID=A0A9P8MWM2_9HYPO|nr:uncharacterized protein HRG_06819 [Hirsutella rhossiliensis]KAH0961739.1 hypothetical protein HRG_06819 [Hirsutella rhossiliensis]
MGANNPDGKRNTAFQHRVLDAMAGSRTSSLVDVRNENNVIKPYVRPDGPGIDPDLFNRDDDETTLYIMTPSSLGKSKDKGARNPTRVKEMSNKVKEILGREPRKAEIIYEAFNWIIPAEAAQVNLSHRGMCLFQYDPNSNGKGQKAWRLFNEDNWATGVVS